jgi:hypothetical protein
MTNFKGKVLGGMDNICNLLSFGDTNAHTGIEVLQTSAVEKNMKLNTRSH